MRESQSHPAAAGPDLGPVVEALCQASRCLLPAHLQPHLRRTFPSRAVVQELVEDLRSVLFPGYFGASELTGETLRYQLGATLDRVRHGLQEQIRRGFQAVCEDDAAPERAWDGRARALAQAFIQELPEIRRLLGTDVEAAYEGDPALSNAEEAIFCYPGILAVTSQRLAHALLRLGVPLLPRMITEHAHSLTGIDIHPGARIGEGFFIDHGTGVVIGETAVIGAKVRIYQGVTLGAKSFPLDDQGNPVKGIERHPIVEDGVVIYSNATILGRVTIGRGAVIGGNVWLTRSVEPGVTVTL